MYVLVSFVLWFAKETIDNMNFERSRKNRATVFVTPFVLEFSDFEFKE
jgi:hypothetical protein